MTVPGWAELGAARAYHVATKHSWQSVRASAHGLDWETKPLPFKIYPDATLVSLPREVAPLPLPALTALSRVAAPQGSGRLDLGVLGQLLFFSAGLTRKRVYPGGETFHFRAFPSTGALYEVEVYVVAGPLPDLEPGVYHFSPGDFALRRLRPGDCRGVLADLASEPDRVRAAPVTVVLSAIYWRNTWKYRARAYRHFFWDAGTLLANLLASAVAVDVAARVLLGFADSSVNALLGLDESREGSLALIPLGAGAARPPEPTRLDPLALRTVPLSSREIDEPLVRAAYVASSLPDGRAAYAWAGRPGERAALRDDRPILAGRTGGPPLSEVILRRGSTRRFAQAPIAAEAARTILAEAIRELPLDLQGGDGVDSYVLVHAVEGLAPGAYRYEPQVGELRLLRAGQFRAEGGYLCLEQALGADASLVVFFLSDLARVLDRHGSRGYRAVNLVAGLFGGRMYLAAYALGLGASGLTFFDDDVVRFFSPDAAGKDAIFVMALGRAYRRPDPAR